MLCRWAWIVCAFALPTLSLAQTKYVDDTLYLGFYKEAGGSGAQFSSVPSGTKLTFIESKNSYSLVRTEKGTEGWVKSKYLVDKPPAVVRIKALEQVASRADALAGEVESLNQENVLLRTEIDTLKKKLASGENEQIVLASATQNTSETDYDFDSEQIDTLKSAVSDALQSLQKVTETAQAASGVDTLDNGKGQSTVNSVDVLIHQPQQTERVQFAQLFEQDTSFQRVWQYVVAEVREIKILHYILIVSAALASFLLGMFVLDRRIRKQHGGYRIW